MIDLKELEPFQEKLAKLVRECVFAMPIPAMTSEETEAKAYRAFMRVVVYVASWRDKWGNWREEFFERHLDEVYDDWDQETIDEEEAMQKFRSVMEDIIKSQVLWQLFFVAGKSQQSKSSGLY